MTPTEVAQHLGLKLSTVWALCRRGALPHIRIGRHIRIPQSRLERWLSERPGVSVEESLNGGGW